MPAQELGNGKYRVLRRLAVGGMAEIFLAEAGNIHGFRKKVVIKRILPQYADDQSYVDMFLDEARLAARLNHASIVQVFDIGEDPEGVFFTMEYVDGRDLAEVLGACYKQGRTLSLEEVLAVLMPAAEALHHAHELRDDAGELCHLIHRDVSPSNILVTTEGRVKLLDFGVAKSNEQQRETTGVSLKGKFGYMAPEQCRGLKLDRRSDIFSFGVVLWELCTGRRLYPGGNDPGVLMKIMNEDALPPSSRRPNLPPGLDTICLKALARERDDRYSTLKEIIVDLDIFAKSSGIVTNSRTLSNLLSDVLPESRTSKVKEPGSNRSLPLPAPPENTSHAGTPQTIGQSGTGSLGNGIPLSEQPSEQSQPIGYAQYGTGAEYVGAPDYDLGSVMVRKKSKLPWLLLGATILLVAGFFAISGDVEKDQDSTEPAVSEPAVSEPAVSEPAVSDEPIAGEDPVVAKDPVVANPVDPDAGVVAKKSPEDGASKAAKDADTKKTKAIKKGTKKTQKTRPKVKDKTRPKDKISGPTKPKEKWDPNSPFAPE